MIVANVMVHTAARMGFNGISTTLTFNDMEKAEAAYQRIAGLIKSNERSNGAGGETVEVEAADGKITFPVRDLKQVFLQDLAKAESELKESVGKYPTLYRQPKNSKRPKPRK